MTALWADQPYPLISTEAFSTDRTHAANYVATEMTLAHNGIIRGLNSIYNQASHIPSDDLVAIKDFLVYCQCWSESMHHHHDAEEEIFFPNIEEITSNPAIMEKNIQQHREFQAGFETFHEHVKTCPPANYSGNDIRALIEVFAQPLVKHLQEEIDTLRALNVYDGAQIRQAYKRLEKKLMDTDNYRVGSLVFGTADRRFEGGRHNFPAVPFIVPYFIHHWYARRYRGAWRYNPCTFWRDRRSLAYTETS